MTATPSPTLPERHPQYPRAIVAYGTLRPGGSNYHHTIGHLRHEALNVWVEGWGLYVAGSNRAFPYACPDPGTHLIGTLLEFPEDDWPQAIDACDWLEGYPHHYTRSVITAHYPKPGGAQIKAWIYHPARGLDDLPGIPRRIPSGDWFAADSPRRQPVSIATHQGGPTEGDGR